MTDIPKTCPVKHDESVKEKEIEQPKCPVDHSAYQHFIPPNATTTTTTATTTATATVKNSGNNSKDEVPKCPVDPTSYKHFIPASKDGCDSNAINSSNRMPNISQQPQPDQKIPLGKERETSTIPRSNSEDKLWIYPSEQMFFNAMKRKNWNPDEKDMAVVVPIHNAVNEMAWQKILEWERLHQTECNQPMLEKFEGRPKDITPKARLRSFFGYALPFDRHDWVVDRCGEKVTYVIDFYSGKQDPNRPMSLSFYLDVRPALTPSGLWDRLRMSFKKGQFI